MRILRTIAFACLCVAASIGGSVAADLNKIPANFVQRFAAAAPLDVAKGWADFYAGADVYGSGTGVNVLDLGQLSSNGSFMGVTAGFETYNGQTLLGGRASIAYDIGTSSDAAAASFSDKLFWRVGGDVGGNLAGAFNVNPVNNPFPDVLLKGIPFANVSICGHHGAVGRCAGGGMKWIVPNSRWDILAEYINADFNKSVVTGQTLKVEQIGMVGAHYHW